VARVYMEIPNAIVIPKFLFLNEILWIYHMTAICVTIKVMHFLITLGSWVEYHIGS
jgi:hypothetical protein